MNPSLISKVYVPQPQTRRSPSDIRRASDYAAVRPPDEGETHGLCYGCGGDAIFMIAHTEVQSMPVDKQPHQVERYIRHVRWQCDRTEYHKGFWVQYNVDDKNERIR